MDKLFVLIIRYNSSITYTFGALAQSVNLNGVKLYLTPFSISIASFRSLLLN